MNNPTLQRAQLLFQQGRFDLAADALRETLAQDPQVAYAHSLLGLCLLQQKKYEEATAEAQLAIHHAPDSAFGHYVLGVTFQDRNRFAEAQTAATEAVRIAPEDPDYWGLLAQTFFSRKRWQEAADAAAQGLQFDPDNTACTNLRAMALVQLGQKEAASLSIADALRRNPHSASTHASQGWALLHQNNPRQALEHFREALRLDPNNDWARQGTMEALKARHLLYRIMLRYYLWMSKFSSRGQWGIVIGLWIGVQVLQSVETSYPAMAPLIIPLLIAYAVFVLASWLATPVFNLTLLFSRFGRHLLTATQRMGAIIVGLLLLSGIVLIPVAIAIHSHPLLFLGVLAALLTLPTAATFRGKTPYALAVMGAYTAALAICGISAIILIPSNEDAAMTLVQITVYGCMLSSLAANIFGSIIPKK
jgi:tetratricopeptide (TPR) repeat protein